MHELIPYFRPATPADAHMPSFDHTKISAVFTCPTWGVVRYGHNKVYAPGARAMALEAGQAMHEVFAAVRLYDWAAAERERHGWSTSKSQVWVHHVNKILPRCDGDLFLRELSEASIDARGRFALHALHQSGFTDDEWDKRRTMGALEEATLVYNLRWDEPGPGRFPVFYDRASGFLGIEIAFDIVCEYEDRKPFRFVGRIDGVHVDSRGQPRIQENKTGARIDSTWASSFATSHQVTGYAFATSVITGLDIRVGDAIGTQIPPPKSRDLAGLVTERFERSDRQFSRWFEWLLTGVSMYETYHVDPTQAPQFTHSCNRYFRPCSLIPFCSSDEETQREMLAAMGEEVWSPLRGESES